MKLQYVVSPSLLPHSLFFFFNDTATTEIYTLSLHDALPISDHVKTTTGTAITTEWGLSLHLKRNNVSMLFDMASSGDRKSTRLNSSHVEISYAVFCLKKKKKKNKKKQSPNVNTTKIRDISHV